MYTKITKEQQFHPDLISEEEQERVSTKFMELGLCSFSLGERETTESKALADEMCEDLDAPTDELFDWMMAD